MKCRLQMRNSAGIKVVDEVFNSKEEAENFMFLKRKEGNFECKLKEIPDTKLDYSEVATASMLKRNQ